MSDLFAPSPADRDEEWVTRAIERIPTIKTMPDFWQAVELMRKRRERLSKEQNARISAALAKHWETLKDSMERKDTA